MRFFLAILLLSTITTGSLAAHADYTTGYTRRDGTYVNGYNRSTPNATTYDNYSTRGNTNPYTGERGYINPNPSPTFSQPNTRDYGSLGSGRRRGW